MQTADKLPDADFVRLESAIASAKVWLEMPVDGFGTTDANAAETAVRVIYTAVSDARELVADKSLFPSEAYRATGTDPMIAMGRVLDDVTRLLHGVDNRIFNYRFRGAGLYITPTLLRDRAIAGGPVEIKWTIGAHNAPVTIQSAIASVGGGDSEQLVDDLTPLLVNTGEARILTSSFALERYHVDALESIALTLTIDTGDGTTTRYHALRAVYVEHPVDIAARFDRGRMLDGSTLPINVVVKKRAAVPSVVRYEWYSPTGLQVAEGRSGDYTMHAEQDSVSLPLTVKVPSPCRPAVTRSSSSSTPTTATWG